ncbi:MAG TPA: hypothetical protein VF651_07605 [Gammaproteobacteria bacterium]
MGDQTDSKQINFLHGTWRALLHDQTEPFEKDLLKDYVSSNVIGRLPRQTTLTNVMHECQAQGAFQESYIKSFLALPKAWDKLTPESRHTILVYVQKCGLHKNAGIRLKPLEDDEAALTIRWDTANRLYAAARDQAFQACRRLGLEVTQPRSRPRPNEFATLAQLGQEILIKLLRERVNIDKTAVTMAVGYVTPVASAKLGYHLRSAYAECRDALYAALLHWAFHHPSEVLGGGEVGARLTAEQEAALDLRVREQLKPFEYQFEGLCADLENMSSEPTIYEKVRRCFQEAVVLH